jgi:hypothetical protein
VRLQYLGKISPLDDRKEVGRSVFAMLGGGEEEQSPIRLLRQYGVTTDTGTIHACDVNLPGVQAIDLGERDIRQIKSPTMMQPSIRTVDPVTDELYVVEDNRDEIVVLGVDGMFKSVVPMDVWIDYANLDLYRDWVHPDFTLKHPVLVANQLSPDKLAICGFVEPRQGR